MIDAMFYEVFEEEEKALRKHLPKKLKAQFTRKTIQEHNNKSLPSGLISIRTQSHIPNEWSKELKGVLSRSQGYDHLLKFRREIEKNVSCGYLGSYCARAAAEQATMIMFVLLRKLKKQIDNFETFSRDGLTGQECRGRNVFVVGVGHIGGEIVNMAQGLQMNVRGFDVEKKIKNLTYISLARGIPWADIIFCALSLNEQTDKMLDYKILKKAKPGCIFINIARGEISPIKDLKRLIDENILGGLGLDVYPEEPILAQCLRGKAAHNPSNVKIIRGLARKEQVIFTPHNAFNTTEALEQKAKLSVKSVVQFLKSETFPSPAPSL